MGLYNMLYGENPKAESLQKILGLMDSANFSIYDWWPPYPFDSVPGENSIWSPAFYEGFDYLSPEQKAEFIQNCIEHEVWITGRYRDIRISRWKDQPVICVTTRNGGLNREAYYYVYEILKHHPNYLGNEDDDFDDSYAYIYFSIPEDSDEH